MPIRKSFFAETVEGAIAEATRQMGAETFLVDSRRTEPAERHLGLYEVIVEGDPPRSKEAALAPAPNQDEDQRSSCFSAGSASRSPELELIRQELSKMRDLLARCAVRMTPALPAELLPIGVQLVNADFSPALVESLLHSAARRTTEGGTMLSEAGLQRAILNEIGGRLHVDAEIGAPGAARKIVALAGPAGSGKTTTLVKLAVRMGLAKHSPTLIISTDTYRVAAADQLRTYAAILGVACEVVETPGALVRALEEHCTKTTVLLDLPGIGPREPELMNEWAPVMSRPEIDVHLVLPATMRCADLVRTARRFEPLRPSHLLFTHLDETTSCGGLLSLSIEAGKPVSFLCAGQGVPEDIESATRHALLRLIGAEPRAAAAAA
jgi:flagellar biosynthesis protein FlhF